MTRFFSLVALLAVAAIPGAASAGQLTLRIHDIPAGGGRLMIAVVASEAAFDGDEPGIASFMLPASSASVELTTSALPDGHYAVRVMHDANGNGELDSNMVGIPTEAWGFSNDASGSFGPPSWDDAHFELGGETTQDIHLNH
ncbi:MAG: DUF2141 domain-containing protein [Gammaproteobacteria bacterium]|jgi:uncharacterized protein (DUF2141 family)|nr:DUF2141 domain-containing protein [Gammaproteobacteria bacterium]